MSIEAIKRALKTFEKIHEGCAFVKEDDLHKDAKDLAMYVQEDCEFTMKTLRQAIAEAEQWDISDMAHRSGGLSVEQEPVAWVSDADFVEGQFVEGRARRVWWECNTGVGQPLYTALPKREWVGLTDEEIDYIWGISPGDYEDKFAFPRAIEAKLREKNT